MEQIISGSERSVTTHQMKRIAHRGARLQAEENTLEAFQKAIDAGADMVELDVQATKDGHLVVFHDPTIDRMMDGIGSIRNFTLEELRKFRTKGGGERIPTLEEVYDLCQNKIGVLTEIKSMNIGKKLAQIIEETKMNAQVIVQSFMHGELLNYREYDKETPTAVLLDELWLDPEDLSSYLRSLKAQGVAQKYSTHALDAIPVLHQNNQFAFFWGFNEHTLSADLAEAEKKGANGVIIPF